MKKNITTRSISVPLTVPRASQKKYVKNYLLATQKSGNLFIFSGDQKVEHLNEDFYGRGISPQDSNPEHLFAIASKARIGAFATQLGLIARYGMDYKKIPYIVKLNSKTNLVKTSQADPQSYQLQSVEDVISFQKKSGLNIVGIGYTVYLGSEYESTMLSQAAQAVFHAHHHGMLAILWMYPRGKAVPVPNERKSSLIAGAAGVGACLGADFVKVNPPKEPSTLKSANLLTQATAAAGRTKIICSGGKQKNERLFLRELYEQIHIGGASGNATGRNIHQKSLKDAIKFCEAIAAIVIDNVDLKKAEKILG